MDDLAATGDEYRGTCELSALDELPGHDLVDLPEFFGGHARFSGSGKGEALVRSAGIGAEEEEKRTKRVKGHGQDARRPPNRQVATLF